VVSSFLAGAGAGLAIAVPVGAIGVLIIELGLRHGFRGAAPAAIGIATADGIYATIAAVFGGAVAGLIVPIERPLRLVSVAVLVVIAIRLLLAARAARSVGADASGAAPRSGRRTYLTFLGLTIVNPATVVYFAALIIGLPSRPQSLVEQLAFAAGAFGASIGWQLILAATSAIGHRRLPASFRAWSTVLGSIIVVAFAILIGADAVRG
jgi:threonine/homoserine/homoserine lactone efflux protein